MHTSDPAQVVIRPYASRDADATLSVFLDAVTQTAAGDYSPKQIAAWARPGQRDSRQWDRARSALRTVVATVAGEVAGFSDVSADGYIDMMFVSPRFSRRGVALRLLQHLEEQARADGATRLWANVSITAEPFFAAQGFHVVAEQHPRIGDVVMTNFRMQKPLA